MVSDHASVDDTVNAASEPAVLRNTTFTDWNGLDRITDPGFLSEHFIGLENYKAILGTGEFWQVLGNTLEYIVLYIPLMLSCSLGVAYLLSRERRGVTAFRIIYYIPVLTSWVAASMIWKSMLSPQYGAVNNILAIFGINGPGWLLDENWAMPAIVLVSVGFARRNPRAAPHDPRRGCLREQARADKCSNPFLSLSPTSARKRKVWNWPIRTTT